MSEPTNIETSPAPDLAGYPTPDALAQGYRASGAEAQRQKQRADALEQQMQAMFAANQRQAPQSTDPTIQQLTDLGIPVAAVEELIERKVQSRIGEAFGSLQNGLHARNNVAAQYPDYVKFEHDVMAYINADPQTSHKYNAMFKVDPEGAVEYAFLKFGESRRRTAPQPQSGESTVHATIPSNRSGESRRQPDAGDRVQNAWENYQRSGSKQAAEAYAKARLFNVVTDEFLNQ